MFMKNRLSEILITPADPDLLKKAEHFQNNFVLADELFTVLRGDIFSLDEMLGTTSFKSAGSVELIKIKYRNISKLMTLAERKFNGWKQEFNNYVFDEL